MKKNLLKFTVLLSTISLMGMQAGEAKKVECPEPVRIVPTPQADRSWKYEGNTEVTFTGTKKDKFRFSKDVYLYADNKMTPEGQRISCSYTGYDPENRRTTLKLISHDPTTESCKPNITNQYFNCP